MKIVVGILTAMLALGGAIATSVYLFGLTQADVRVNCVNIGRNSDAIKAIVVRQDDIQKTLHRIELRQEVILTKVESRLPQPLERDNP
ncbi:MAG: hypothetical protein ABIH03_12330 [Pseudomonadota bacterium]